MVRGPHSVRLRRRGRRSCWPPVTRPGGGPVFTTREIKAADEMFAEHLAQFEDTKLKRRKRKKGKWHDGDDTGTWTAVRPVNREAVDRHKARMRSEVRAFRLRELRAARSSAGPGGCAGAPSAEPGIQHRTATSAPHGVNTLRKCDVRSWRGELVITVTWEMRHSPGIGTNRSHRSWPDTNTRRPSVVRGQPRDLPVAPGMKVSQDRPRRSFYSRVAIAEAFPGEEPSATSLASARRSAGSSTTIVTTDKASRTSINI